MRSDGPSRFPLPRRGGRGAPVDESPEAPEPSAPPAGGETAEAVVDCAIYEGGRRRGGDVPFDRALEEVDACDGCFAWIGVHDPGPGVVEEIGRHFGLHPLAIEDAVHAHQRPKLEIYGDTLLLVLKTARYVDSEELVEIGEVLVFAGETFVVTVRHGEGSALHGVRRALEARPHLLEVGSASVVYAVADRVVDDYEAVIEGFSVDIDEIEAEVFSSAKANPTERIYRLKRELLEFRRAVTPLQSPMQRLASGQGDLPVDKRMAEWFRDVYDHLVRTAERIAAFDDLLNGVLQANLAQLSVRDNQDMRRISAWVAILAVPTMVFGLYGMNFDHMPELHWRVGYPLVLLVVGVLCALLWRRFKRAGWL